MEIINCFPGRVRIKINSLYKNNELSQIAEMYLNELEGVQKVKANPVLGTITLDFDSGKIDLTAVKSSVICIIKNKMHLKYIREKYGDYLNEERKFRSAKKKMLIFGSLYLIYKIKQHYFGKFFINRSLPVLQAAALVTLIRGYPQLRNTYKKLTSCFTGDSDKFLLISGTLLTLSREGNEGIVLLFLKAFADALHSYSKLQIERTLISNNIFGNSFVWYNHGAEEYLLPLRSLDMGDTVTFYEHEPISVDGAVKEGNALINNIYYSGQPELRRVGADDSVHEGMLVVSG